MRRTTEVSRCDNRVERSTTLHNGCGSRHWGRPLNLKLQAKTVGNRNIGWVQLSGTRGPWSCRETLLLPSGGYLTGGESTPILDKAGEETLDRKNMPHGPRNAGGT